MVADSKSKRQAARRNQLGIPSAWISKAPRTMLRSMVLIITHIEACLPQQELTFNKGQSTHKNN